MPGFNGTAALAIVRENDPDVPFIFLSGTIGEEIAVEAMRTGAQDYVLKGNAARLIPSIRRSLAEAEIRRAHKATEQRLRQLEKFEAIGKLAGGIAHDFNNVIGAIMGWSELGLEKVTPESQAAHYFRRIGEQSQRAADLTRQLLAYARRQILEPRNINLNEVVNQAAALLERVIGEHVEIEKVLAPDLWTTSADPTQIEQVLLNLCFNARDAMPKGGTLRIQTRNIVLDEDDCQPLAYAKPGQYVQLAVSDTGTGMDSETMSKIFEPFFTTKEVGKGTGLGLATAFGIVKQHQGHVEVSSEVGKGSIFHINLPRSEGTTQPRQQPEEMEVRGGTETILVAEDHEGSREMSQQVLESLGYKVVTASDGEDAIRKFNENCNDVSLVVLDVVMPKLGGPDLYAKLSKIKPKLPVIFTTGYSEQGVSLLDAAEVDAPAVLLQKPHGPKVLARRVRDLLDRTRANPAKLD
jgi:signal transduction histidine kinase